MLQFILKYLHPKKKEEALSTYLSLISNPLFIIGSRSFVLFYEDKKNKGQPNVQSFCQCGVLEKDWTILGLLYAVLAYIVRGFFPRFEPMTIRSHGDNFTIALSLPFYEDKKNNPNKTFTKIYVYYVLK